MKTVKEMSQLSGVSVCTLHYYDEIDLLKPSQVAENGYRYYDHKAIAEQIKLLELKKAHLEGVLAHARRLQDGGDTMTFTAFDKSQLEALETEAKERWGDTQAYQAFAAKTDQKDFAKMTGEMSVVMAEFGRLKNLAVTDDKVQTQVKVLQDYISENFYLCSPEILASLGKMYVADNRFSQTIDQVGGVGTAQFVSQAIAHYCKG
ncbi:MerR family transcriptional regulator [Streptococcus sobrinus]|uniref:MerR family DNA-binding transcriptional regulator n=1 Tax=Streptococcus sobrinus TaxID=1310 RepID=A0ABM6W486_9STRE|nr:TipAS antibiotic-recognition domain-containing protein [Streptococcus sobrinus]AWN20273.1 MerR family DNA-binding transcriptional regulator [Streptococcus sobrinus]EMP72237.1 transcriptional regulator [Streptococcus sobrinus DSM 20742 = ATCC 33478]SQG12997.1 Transcriptional regulator, MerR family [Streptococcus sobrinus]